MNLLFGEFALERDIGIMFDDNESLHFVLVRGY